MSEHFTTQSTDGTCRVTTVKAILRAIILYILLVGVQPSTGQPSAVDWLIDLHVEDIVNGLPVAARDLSFGVSSDGTDGIDPTLGETELPPYPPGGLHVIFVSDLTGNGLSSDIRSNTDSVLTFNIQIQHNSNTETIKITWDNPPLAAIASAAWLDDPINGSFGVVNMLTTDNISLPTLASEVRIVVHLSATGSGYNPVKDPNTAEYNQPGGDGYNPAKDPNAPQFNQPGGDGYNPAKDPNAPQ